jgi:hypothetical protein
LEKSAELIETIINKIPWLLWPLLIALFLWGLLLILKQLYGLVHEGRKNYITELKEHLNFKEMIIDDISAQKAQLENQYYELREEACRKDEIINETVSIITERETALQELKDDTDRIIRQLKFALGTALWISEREMRFRRIFLLFLSKATIPTDIGEFLSKNIGSIVPLITSDDQIYYQEADPEVTGDFLELRATVLSPLYLHLPMNEEIALFNSLNDEILKLPSFVDTEDAVDDNKS